MREWSTLRRMKEARDAYWWGYVDYALEILMEIADEEINCHVKETFDLSCQPRPKESKVRPRAVTPSHSQGQNPPAIGFNIYGGDDWWED